jgi:broad specificity phosphatase PhoE
MNDRRESPCWNYGRGLVIFVRHGRAIVGPDAPEQGWSLDPALVDGIHALRDALPDLPVVCSDMRRAVETAAHFGDPVIDARLREVSRPLTLYLDSVVPAFDAMRRNRVHPRVSWSRLSSRR